MPNTVANVAVCLNSGVLVALDGWDEWALVGVQYVAIGLYV